jgi:cell division protein FtsI/penicillin-binding protein 2
LLLRLAYWHIFKASELQEIASMQYGLTSTIPAPRGQIKASDGFPLVKNQDTYLLYANPQVLKLSSLEKNSLTNILKSSESAKQLEMSESSPLSWYPIQHFVSLKTKSEIDNLGLSGLGFNSEPSRLYPEGSSSAYITGFVGQNTEGENQGYFGLEGYFNRALAGKPGKISQDSDALNRPIVIGIQNEIAPQIGQNIITTIDRTVQYFVTNKLAEGIEKYQAKSGNAVVMETKTGNILAMVSLPGYDPQKYREFDTGVYKNPIVSDGFEPGSTFKVIVMASALDAGAVNSETVCTTCNSAQLISGKLVKNYNDKYYPDSLMPDIILHSDNVGMVFVGRKLGAQKLLQYLKNFGLGNLTGIEQEEEDSPNFRSAEDWRDIDLATATFGQGIALTRIQMVTAVNAIANQGVYIKPRLVSSIEEGNLYKDLPPKESHRVVSQTAAYTVTQMMKNGVNNGEVRYYKLPGYEIAGKTGTAQVPIEGHYDNDKVIASFVGFAPADNPKFTMLVTLREPKTSPWGSTTSAPLWFSIAKELLRYYRIPPQGIKL